MSILIQWLISTAIIMVSAYVLPGVHVSSWWTAVVVAIVLAVVNALIKPVFVLLTLPITIISLGLFLLVINALMIMLVGLLVPGFKVDGFWWALAFSIVLSVFNFVISSQRR